MNRIISRSAKILVDMLYTCLGMDGPIVPQFNRCDTEEPCKNEVDNLWAEAGDTVQIKSALHNRD